jgi:hypothetical protein
MRIWHVSVILAVVVMLFAGQLVLAQATTQPAGGTAKADAREDTGGDTIGADKTPEETGGEPTTQKKPPGGRTQERTTKTQRNA